MYLRGCSILPTLLSFDSFRSVSQFLVFVHVCACLYLHSVLGVGGFVDASFADREGAHADVLLQYVAVTEQQVLAV